mmetsp:Transcript_65648/g.189267  ORF Transcript_65648/g.189267 Transcript_65648/m.189267 type:complete len:279 (+) Transcript_65648:1409-2245(+)
MALRFGEHAPADDAVPLRLGEHAPTDDAVRVAWTRRGWLPCGLVRVARFPVEETLQVESDIWHLVSGRRLAHAIDDLRGALPIVAPRDHRFSLLLAVLLGNPLSPRHAVNRLRPAVVRQEGGVAINPRRKAAAVELVQAKPYCRRRLHEGLGGHVVEETGKPILALGHLLAIFDEPLLALAVHALLDHAQDTRRLALAHLHACGLPDDGVQHPVRSGHSRDGLRQGLHAEVRAGVGREPAANGLACRPRQRQEEHHHEDHRGPHRGEATIGARHQEAR